MAKKFVRGVTGVSDITKLDKSLTNVNDLVSDGQNTYVHTKKGKNEFYYKLTDKQNTITNNDSIGVDGTGLLQLYTKSQTYSHANGVLKTHVKSVANSASVSTLEEEFNFLAKMNETQTSADFTLNEHDTAVFEYLIDTYGLDNKINVCGAVFTLNGSNLNFNTNGAQYNPHIINFNDIIPTSAINATQ